MGPKDQGRKAAQQKALAALDKCTAVPPSLQGKQSAQQQWAETTELVGALAQLMDVQDDPTYLSSQPPTDFAQFEAWLQKEKFPECDVTFGHTDTEGNCLLAKKDLKKGDLVVVVPSSFMLMATSQGDRALGTVLQSDPLLAQMPSTALAVRLVAEARNINSHWAPYIAMLPRTFSTALFFTLEEIQALKPSPLYVQVQRYLRSLVRQYLHLHRLLAKVPVFKEHELTFREFRWAVSVVMTRQNKVPVSVGGGQAMQWGFALIPVWDFANHTTEGEITTFYSTETQATECYAVRDFKQGEQVYIYYGPRTCSEFLMHNGFVPPPGPHDTLSVPLGVSPSDPSYNAKAALLAKVGLEPSGNHTLTLQPRLDERLLSFLRIFVMDPPQLAAAANMDPAQMAIALTQEQPLSSKNEAAVCDFLIQRCRLLMMQYQAKGEVPAPGSVLCRQLHAAEKNVLEHTLELVQRIKGPLPADDQ